MNSEQTSVTKTIQILMRLAEKPYEFSVLELSEELGLNRSTVYRNLNALREVLIVTQNPASKKYRLGPTAYNIGSTYLTTFDYLAQIRTILTRICTEIGQTIGFAKLEGDRVLDLIEIETYQPIRIGRKEGSYYPIHCGTYGKCTMAFYEPRDRLEELVRAAELPRYARNTITDPDRLLAEYALIRERGYAISDEEHSDGLIGIGAPVFDASGRIFGCVATALIKSASDEDTLATLIPRIIEGAAEVSKYIV